MEEKLLNYVKQSIVAGKEVDEIKKELLNTGWQQNVVDEAINQVSNQAGSKKNKKPTFYLMTVVFVIIIAGISGFLLLRNSQESETETSSTKDAELTLEVTNSILGYIGEKKYTDALQYFVYGGEGEPTREDILTTLALIETAYKEEGEFKPQTSLDNIEILGNEAQSLVKFTINGQRAPIRFDFQKKGNDWKVNTVVIGGELKLLEEKEARSIFDSYSASDYFTSAKSFKLKNSDTVEIRKNVLSSEENIEFKIGRPQEGYIVALSEPPYIRTYREIRAKSTYTDYYELGMDFFKTNYGLFLIYPEGTKMSLKQTEISEEPILQIPFKIEAD